MVLINVTTPLSHNTAMRCYALRGMTMMWAISIHTGGRAHSVAVLSALVLRNENSVGCQRPEMTLS